MVAGLDGEHVTGLHVVTDPLTAAATATFLPGMAGRLDEDDPVDKLILDRMDAFRKEGSGYLAIQNSRPQTIGYGLADSPLLQIAWIAEKATSGTTCRSTATSCSPRSACTGLPAPAPPPRTPSTSRHTPPTGARRRPCRRASRSSAPTRRSASWSPRRIPHTGASSSAASTSPRWRPQPSWPRTCRPSSGRCTDRCPGRAVARQRLVGFGVPAQRHDAAAGGDCLKRVGRGSSGRRETVPGSGRR
jgi:hypothetical protein